MDKKIVGYTTGVFDLFHIGHLNLLKNAKSQCDYLIVGISTDEVVKQNKGKNTVICFEERKQIVEAIKYVDKVVPQYSYDEKTKISAVSDLGADILFVGSDWKGTDKWNRIEAELNALGKKVVYLTHTDGISSSILREQLNVDGKQDACKR